MFNFKTKPYAHQLTALELSCDRPEYALFMDMGTGKTKVAIDNFCYLYAKKEIDTVLILSNKGSYLNWVNQEIPIHMPDEIPRHLTYWNNVPSKFLQTTYAFLLHPLESLKIMVMNTEALAHERAFDFALELVQNTKCMIIVDESTSIKNEGAKRTKNIIELGKHAKYRRILTGEPIANSPLDIWAQAKFLNPTLLRFSSFYSFRAYYAKMIDLASGPRTFKKITGYNNIEQLEKNIATWSYRIKKEECLDLPAKIYQTYNIQLTEEQQRLYDQLREESIAWLSQEAMVSTPLAITKLLRLHQLTCGHIVDDFKNSHPIANKRIDALMEIIEEAQGKIIIWATYRKNIEDIREAIVKKYGPGVCATYYGDTSDDSRSEAIADFQEQDICSVNNASDVIYAHKKGVRFFIGNPKTGGYGITLTAANTVIYYSNNYELETRLQSEDRCHRIGQTKPVNYIDIVCEKTVDEKIIKALKAKKHLSATILGDELKDWL